MMGLRGLDLTDEQQAAVKGIMETSRKAAEPLHQQLEENQAKLKALGTDGTLDQAQAQALATEHGGIMANMVLERVKTKAQVFGLLTEDQRAKAASMPDKFGKGRGHRKGGDKQPRGEAF
jgi:Spy/CpxP family protein refolding chaperone